MPEPTDREALVERMNVAYWDSLTENEGLYTPAQQFIAMGAALAVVEAEQGDDAYNAVVAAEYRNTMVGWEMWRDHLRAQQGTSQSVAETRKVVWAEFTKFHGHGVAAKWGTITNAPNDALDALIAAVRAENEQIGRSQQSRLSELEVEFANLRGAQGARDEALRELPALLGGWRELIALLDDMPKDEAVGKAMWAALDQIDRTRAALATRAAAPTQEAPGA